MKTLLPALALLTTLTLATFTLTGCRTGFDKIVKEAAKDPATASITVTTIYGNFVWHRSNPVPGMNSSIGPDGTLIVGTVTNLGAGPVPVPVKPATPTTPTAPITPVKPVKPLK
jgi:ABC-type Fe3+-hydroxamate transport system substrate-binding protein